jgi:protoheme IX farnesyltransferase
MTPISQAAVSSNLAAPAAETTAHGPDQIQAHIHAPSPGATAVLIGDLRELFKVKVVTMVLVTGWGGFYLGSMQSGISSLQRGLLDTLLGIGLVSAGAGALNEAIERKTDALMLRTADRPLASGRFSLLQGIIAGLGAIALGATWLALHTNLLTVALALLTAFCYVAIYTPLKRLTPIATFVGAFPGPSSAGPPPAAASSGRAWLSSPSSLSGSFLTSTPSPGSIVTTTPAPAFACCLSSSPMDGPPSPRRSSSPSS